MFVGVGLTCPYIRRAGGGAPHGRCGHRYGLSDGYSIIGYSCFQGVFTFYVIFYNRAERLPTLVRLFA